MIHKFTDFSVCSDTHVQIDCSLKIKMRKVDMSIACLFSTPIPSHLLSPLKHLLSSFILTIFGFICNPHTVLSVPDRNYIPYTDD